MTDPTREAWERDQALEYEIVTLIAAIDKLLAHRPGVTTRTQIALSLALSELREERSRLQGVWS